MEIFGVLLILILIAIFAEDPKDTNG